MNLFLKRNKSGINAIAIYDISTNTLVVQKGSKVSSFISRSDKFRGSKTIEEYRKKYVDKKNVVIEDVEFNSPSTAANFITGNSTNGLLAWKNESGIRLKEMISEERGK